MTSLNKLFNYITYISKKYNIDESHGIKHSMDVLRFAYNILNSELSNNPSLGDQVNVIYVSALLHDMCDKKYMNEEEGIHNLEEFIGVSFNTDELEAIKNIINTMSYSKVMKNGHAEFPDLGKWQLAYNIVREADLLAAYDFDRCMIYNMEKKNGDFDTALIDAKQLFEIRVFKHFEYGLFFTDKGKELGRTLHISAIDAIKMWNNLSTKNMLL